MRKGQKHSPETKKKLAEAYAHQILEGNHPRLGKKHSAEAKTRMSVAHKKTIAERPESKQRSVRALTEWVKSNGVHNKGKKRGFEERKKQSATLQGVPLDSWTGFSKPERARAMNTMEYKNWRFAVMARDGFKCVWCGSQKELEADHIEPWKVVELRYTIANGRTLCHDCHEKTDTFAPNLRRNKI